jgi:tryptophanyl-tRNA synthetase
MKDQKVINYLEEIKKIGVDHKIVEHPYLKTVDEVLRYCNLGLDEGASTLIYKADDGYIAVIRRDDCKINIKALKKLAQTETLTMATDEEFTKITGLEPGAARVYIPNVKSTYIDQMIFEKEYVQAGSGSFTISIQYKTSDLLKLPRSQKVNIAEIKIKTQSLKYLGKQRVFSGIRATGRLHLGNYLGAVKGFLELEKTGNYETVYCVVDVHSITTPFDKNELAKNKREIIIDYLAAGLDPKKSIIIYQSDIPEHIELAFYFSSVVTIARMQHLPTYKDKVKQHPNANTMALLNYPVLMASDILIYKAGLVPVGIDQEPHLEVAREIARKMNQLYGTDFPEPVRFATKGEYVPSLTGTGKMGKSIEGSYINLTDSLEQIRKKVRSIPTATVSGGEITGGLKSLFAFAQLFMPEEVEKYKKEFEAGTLKFVTLKDAVSDAIYKELEPFQKRRAEIAANQKYVDEVIKDGAERARKIARETVHEVKKKMGLL